MHAYLRSYFLRWSGGALQSGGGGASCILRSSKRGGGEQSAIRGEISSRFLGGRMRGVHFEKVNSNSRLATSERDVLSAKRVPPSVLS